jgi:uncharacterized protein YcgI (DUF1989 family)
MMCKFLVPGTMVKEWIIAAKGYDAFVMKKGEILRFVNIADAVISITLVQKIRQVSHARTDRTFVDHPPPYTQYLHGLY